MVRQWTEIVSKNGIQDANKIYIGQKLTINETTEEPAEIPALVETSTDSTQSESNQTTDTNLSSSEAAAKEEIAQRESSGSYTPKRTILWTLSIIFIIFEW